MDNEKKVKEEEEVGMDNEKKEIEEKDTKAIWWRGLYMALFAFLFGMAKVVMVAVVVFQFFTVVITDKKNEKLLKFGNSLSRYMYEIMLFQTFNNDNRPFPIGSWPNGEQVVK